MAYLLDADVFIRAKNLHYGFDFGLGAVLGVAAGSPPGDPAEKPDQVSIASASVSTRRRRGLNPMRPRGRLR